MTTLVLEEKDYSQKALALYKKLGDVFFWRDLDEKQKNDISAKTDILIVRLAHKIDKKWLDKMPNLKAVVSNTTGLNHLDLAEMKKRKIKVISLKGRVSFLKNVTATAEETLGLILALARNIPWAFDDVKNGHWNRDKWKGHQMLGKKLGLLGCGRLGKIMAKYGRALGMEVMACDPHVSNKSMKKSGIQKTDMKNLFHKADVLTVHVSLEKDTENLVREKYFRMMKPSAYFINTSRGEIIDERALLDALKEKQIAGAGLDVMQNEVENKHLPGNKLIDYTKNNSNLIILPHLGGAAYEAMHITEEFVANIAYKIFCK
ncbi:MAG: hypothetical protein A3B04_04025 [Candidatus Portnoybacteria bacterium RIFCSPLOWO2_02_FULL_39_11]|uniref:Hydroxyacid dehydrogenase n=1 Tax=Candidatus Portnoybacteria bacterium RIFCSPLOWO2_02_FULL_39_11 TaxID=1802001 RepID=A0A1G2FMQ1_9BACT|nr:MAG: hypothetical protein A3B04_04025 [Candidatus Portnoybacteria bacterium RIFCSPLOWO2_02_FULL_39_11]